MVFPALILFSIFFIYPLFRGIRLSLTDWDGFSTPNFIGLENFFRFFRDKRALNDVFNTVFFALGSAPLLIIYGLFLALLLDGVARVTILMPSWAAASTSSSNAGISFCVRR